MNANLIIFGATGDLAGRFLLPALAELAAVDALPQDFSLMASATRDMSDEDYRDHAEEKLNEHGAEHPETARSRILDRTGYRSADVTDPADMADLIAATGNSTAGGGEKSPVTVYLALPTGLMPDALRALAAADLPAGSRIAMEKPFGADLNGAGELDDLLGELFGDDAAEIIFNVDHALGMAPLQAMLPLRFSNPLPEAVWNGEHIDEFRVLWEESIALEGRARFYDSTGALKDVLQNHLMQVLTMSAMERPEGIESGWPSAAALRARKTELLSAVRPLSDDDVLTSTRRARYTAGTLANDPEAAGKTVSDYIDEDGVDGKRDTETFAEVVLYIDSPRWEGTRFRLRTGKAIARARKGIEILFRPVGAAQQGARLWVGLDGPFDVELALNTSSSRDRQATMSLIGDQPRPAFSPYGHVLKNVLEGESDLSAGPEESTLAWQILTPVLKAWEAGSVPMEDYRAGSLGPDEGLPSAAEKEERS
ncbi:glucose-6-phosphate dehydrogenase [Brevibacterium sp. UCMA 11754]|uniref:glucose-6-phosphate dehydrogenase n=1 Tax=Brevibacterium sp. UCMA 11754 TaxID=2749198 RepID=UPI001F1C192A|nr:glucose-6-phosphate dehydrogenase [Brevibacterium sp. UCMA 11754]MCF2572647.1 glucose-6-phosphate dehydrogenase [Brevibacterium sp. UCMA 11754]